MMSTEIRRLLEEAWYRGRRSAEDLKIGHANAPQLQTRCQQDLEALLASQRPPTEERKDTDGD